MFFKTISHQATLFICVILGIKQIHIDTKLIHHMAIAVWNIKESICGIHYPIALNILHRLRVLNNWSRIICYRLLFDRLYTLYVWHIAFCLLSNYCDFWFLLIWVYVAVIFWSKPSCISCIFLYFYFMLIFFYFRVLHFSFCCFAV